MGFLYLVDCLISIFLFQKSFIDLNSITWLTVDYKKHLKEIFYLR